MHSSGWEPQKDALMELKHRHAPFKFDLEIHVISTGLVHVQSCLVIIIQYQPISMQFS